MFGCPGWGMDAILLNPCNSVLGRFKLAILSQSPHLRSLYVLSYRVAALSCYLGYARWDPVGLHPSNRNG